MRQRFLTSLHSSVSRACVCIFFGMCVNCCWSSSLFFVGLLSIVCGCAYAWTRIRKHVVMFFFLYIFLSLKLATHRHSRCFHFTHVKLLLLCRAIRTIQHLHWNKHPTHTSRALSLSQFISHCTDIVRVCSESCISFTIFRHTIIIWLFSCKSSNRVAASNTHSSSFSFCLLVHSSSALLLLSPLSSSYSIFYC